MTIPEQLVKNYLIRRWQELENCKNAIERADFLFLQQVGHRLKGNGEMFGFPEISCIGKNLEQEATFENYEQTKVILTKYETFLCKQRE
jgi:hypothetical protein